MGFISEYTVIGICLKNVVLFACFEHRSTVNRKEEVPTVDPGEVH